MEHSWVFQDSFRLGLLGITWHGLAMTIWKVPPFSNQCQSMPGVTSQCQVMPSCDRKLQLVAANANVQQPVTGSGNLCQTARLAIGKERQEERETLEFLLFTELGKSRWRKEVYVESLCRKLQNCTFVWKDGVFYCGNGTFAKSFIECKVSFDI